MSEHMISSRFFTIVLAVSAIALIPPYTVDSQSPPQSDETSIADRTDLLDSRMIVDHTGFENHVFTGGYVYVREIGEYIDVALDGSFRVDGLPEGKYTLETYVPGFERKFATVFIPDQRRVDIFIELQQVAVETVIVRNEIPHYIKDARELLNTPEIVEETPPETPIPLPTGDDETATQPIDLGKFLESVVNSIFGRRRDKERE